MPETPPPLPQMSPLSFAPDAQGSTRTAGESVDEGRGRVFPCEGCGADLKFCIGQQSLKCPYCGYVKELQLAEDAQIEEQDFHAMLARLAELHEHGRHDEQGQSEVRCRSCGGTVVFAGPLTSSECPYCASPIQRDDVHQAAHRIPVDGVLPFLIGKKQAQANLRAWVESRWFAPNEFRRRGIQGRFNGVYLPYWTYDSLTYTIYRGERGEHYWVTVGTGKNRRRERRTRWYPASGRFEKFFDDVLVLASDGMLRDLMQRLEPWPLGQCIPFTQEVLAGYLARTYEIGLEEGFREARGRIDDALRAEVRRRIGGDEQRIWSVQSQYNAVTFKHLLLPVWLLAYRYHDKTYQVMINAGTGAVQGQRPYSWVKIVLLILTILIVGGGIGVLLAQG